VRIRRGVRYAAPGQPRGHLQGHQVRLRACVRPRPSGYATTDFGAIRAATDPSKASSRSQVSTPPTIGQSCFALRGRHGDGGGRAGHAITTPVRRSCAPARPQSGRRTASTWRSRAVMVRHGDGKLSHDPARHRARAQPNWTARRTTGRRTSTRYHSRRQTISRWHNRPHAARLEADVLRHDTAAIRAQGGAASRYAAGRRVPGGGTALDPLTPPDRLSTTSGPRAVGAGFDRNALRLAAAASWWADPLSTSSRGHPRFGSPVARGVHRPGLHAHPAATWHRGQVLPRGGYRSGHIRRARGVAHRRRQRNRDAQTALVPRHS